MGQTAPPSSQLRRPRPKSDPLPVAAPEPRRYARKSATASAVHWSGLTLKA